MSCSCSSVVSELSRNEVPKPLRPASSESLVSTILPSCPYASELSGTLPHATWRYTNLVSTHRHLHSIAQVRGVKLRNPEKLDAFDAPMKWSSWWPAVSLRDLQHWQLNNGHVLIPLALWEVYQLASTTKYHSKGRLGLNHQWLVRRDA